MRVLPGLSLLLHNRDVLAVRSGPSQVGGSVPATTSFFEGSINIGDAPYSIRCQCGGALRGAALAGVEGIAACEMASGLVHTERPAADAATSLSEEEVYDTFAQSRRYDLAPFAEQMLMCVDDRVSFGGVFTFGGEVGELLLALAVMEEHAESSASPSQPAEFSSELLVELLKAYLEEVLSNPAQKLVLCTDEAALQHWNEMVGLKSLTLAQKHGIDQKGVEAALEALTSNHRNIGDTHLSSILESPAAYLVRPALLPTLLTTLLALKWGEAPEAAAKILSVTLVGNSKPAAVVNVHESDGCLQEGKAAVMRPKQATLGGLFVKALIIHEKIVATRRQQIAEFLAKHQNDPWMVKQQGLANAVGSTDTTDLVFFQRLNSVSNRWTELTIAKHYPDCPIYTIDFAS